MSQRSVNWVVENMVPISIQQLQSQAVCRQENTVLAMSHDACGLEKVYEEERWHGIMATGLNRQSESTGYVGGV